MTRTRPRTRICWRHQVDLYTAAFGSLLDLTGRSYPRWSKRIMADTHKCPRCLALKNVQAGH